MANILTPLAPLPKFESSHSVDTVNTSSTFQSYSFSRPEQRASLRSIESSRSTAADSEWCYGAQLSTATVYNHYSVRMSALSNSQHHQEDIMSPYYDAHYNHSMQNQPSDTPPPPFHSRKLSTSERPAAHIGDTALTTAVFLSKLKGISRSKSPNDLYTSSTLPSSSSANMVDLPRTPTSGSTLSGSGSSTYTVTQWSPVEPASPTSPRSRYKKKGGLLKRSFSPTPGHIGPLFKGSKGHGPSALEEFDPTTIRKNRTLRRKNPQDLYDQYDDLFTNDEDTLDEQDTANVGLQASETEYEYSGSDDGYPHPHEVRRLKHPKKRWPEPPRSPPRSVPSPSSSYPNLKNLSSTSPFLLTKWKASADIDTPPQSKSPSMTDLHQHSAPVYANFHLPPTPPSPPPPPPKDQIKKYDNSETSRTSSGASQFTVYETSTDLDFSKSLPGPPPGHAPPPLPSTSYTPSTKSKRESVKEPFKHEDTEVEETADELGPSNVPSNVPRPSTPSSTDPYSHPAASVAPSLPGAASGDSPHRIPRKRVGSSSKVETLNNLMLVAKEISAHVAGEEINRHIGGTGYTPQMRIADVRDLDEFAFASFTDSTPTTPLRSEAMDKDIGFDSNSHSGYITMEQGTTQPTPHLTSSTSDNNNTRITEPEEVTKDADKPDATYLRVFRQFMKSSGENDAFIHRADRFDALQTQRICTHLRNDYQVAPVKKAKKTEEQSSTSSAIIKQREVADKMLTSMWALMSLRWMTFGRLLVSPAHEMLAAGRAKRPNEADSRSQKFPRFEKSRKRVLDLGGTPVGDWGWHCACDYPNSKVYTVTTRTANIDATPVPGSDSTTTFQGPKNHRHITVSYLWRLPFPDNHFDVVSARSLFMALKIHRRPNCPPSIDLTSPLNIMDEYDLCLEECHRVLKPGGYLEFFLLDNDIINPGPLGVELSTKFTSELEANAYDPYPTRKWIQRLNKAGYGDMKRAWMFLPMAPQVKPKLPSKDDDYVVQPQQQPHQRSGSFNSIDAVKEEVRRKLEAWEDLGTTKGSTESVAPVAGLLGSWVWERWMLKTSAEAEENSDWRLALDTIGSVLDEGRDMKSGWRSMFGWARKQLVADSYTYSADNTKNTFSAL